MTVVFLILLILGGLLFVLAALLPEPQPKRLHLVAGGLLAWIVVEVIKAAQNVH